MSLSNQIIYGTAASVAAVIDQVQDLDYLDEYGYTPLIQSAIVDNLDIAKILIARGADVNMPDLTGRSALHWAVDNGNMEFTKLLLENKANANIYTIASQPPLIKPILRHNNELKYLLCRFDADPTFANDYINTKLLGHRFELRGFVDIVDNMGKFTELSYEGFVLEFTLDVVFSSLQDFKNNYAARHLSSEFHLVLMLLDALERAIQLSRYQHYLIKAEENQHEIAYLIQQDPLILPIGQEGHAITVVRYGTLLAICDRAQQDDPETPTVEIFYINRPSKLTVELVVNLLYQRQTLDYVKQTLHQQLALQTVSTLDLPLQLMGNCAWANVEACIPTLMLLYGMQHKAKSAPEVVDVPRVLRVYRQWREWDKERALQFCLQDFADAVPARKAAKVTMLAAIFVQSCLASRRYDVERARRIFPYLCTPGFEYVLQSYLRAYRKTDVSFIARNLRQLIRLCDDYGDYDEWLY